MAVEDLLRELAPQVLGVLTRRYQDFDAAEDATQEAMIIAAERWAADGVPDRPRGWLIQTATRRLIDQRRSEQSRRDRELKAAQEPPPAQLPETDDTLTVLFLCCHPVLSQASAIALTLRAVGGLNTAEIAAAFLVPESTMAQRISRAKKTIKSSGETFRLPSGPESADRLRSVLHVLYLIFNEGYVASSGDTLQRVDLGTEAIRLARLVHDRLPNESEVTGLLALMVLLEARGPARAGAGGELVPLPDQDRSLWDRTMINEGSTLLDEALRQGPAGEYVLQAAIAALHDRAPSADDTDWQRIAELYRRLDELTGNPIVTVNRAIAVAFADGPQAGLDLLDQAAAKLGDHHRLTATRAHLLERAGEIERARELYLDAAADAANAAERDYLVAQASRLA
jgi:RNA polymerase sigma factor (sigma-70 family)